MQIDLERCLEFGIALELVQRSSYLVAPVTQEAASAERAAECPRTVRVVMIENGSRLLEGSLAGAAAVALIGDHLPSLLPADPVPTDDPAKGTDLCCVMKLRGEDDWEAEVSAVSTRAQSVSVYLLDTTKGCDPLLDVLRILLSGDPSTGNLVVVEGPTHLELAEAKVRRQARC